MNKDFDNLCITCFEEGLIIDESNPKNLKKKEIIKLLKSLNHLEEKISKYNKPQQKIMIFEDVSEKQIRDIIAIQMWNELKEYMGTCINNNLNNFIHKDQFSMKDVFQKIEWKEIVRQLIDILQLYTKVENNV